MKLSLSLILIAFCTVLCGQINQKDAQGKRHGLWQKEFPDGQIRYQGHFHHGTPVDTFRHYFDTGGLRTINVFDGKTGHCFSKQYGEEKQLAAEGHYRDQKKFGEWLFYNAQGDLISREEYQAGKRHGAVIKYYPNGQVAEKTQYREGLKDGPWRQFYESGEKMAEGAYRADKLQGMVTYYYSSGKPRLKGPYVEGLMHGTFYHFTPDKKVEKKVEWKEGFIQKDFDQNDTAEVDPFPHK